MIKLHYFKDKLGKYRIRIRCVENGKQVGRCTRLFSSVREMRTVLDLVLASEGMEWGYRDLFSGRDEQWYWRLKEHAHLTFVGGEGYWNKGDCKGTMNTVKDNLVESYKKYGITKDKG